MIYGRAKYKSKGTVAAGGSEIFTTYLDVPYPMTGGTDNFSRGDMLFLFFVHKAYVEGSWWSIQTPSGWTKLPVILPYETQPEGYENLVVGGLGSNANVDQGHVEVNIFYRVATGTETGGVPGSYVRVNPDTWGPSCSQGIIVCYSKPPDSDWTTFYSPKAFTSTDFWPATGPPYDPNIITTTNTWSMSAAYTSFQLHENDLIITLCGINSDVSSFSSQSITRSGGIIDLIEEVIDVGTSYGRDQAMVITNHRVSYDTPGSGSVTYTMTGNNYTSYTPTGAAIMFVLRVEHWPRFTGNITGEFSRTNIKRRNSSSAWQIIDNGVTPGNTLKRKTSDGWKGVSVYSIDLDESTLNFAWNGEGQNKTIGTGNELELFAWETGTQTPVNWITFSSNIIHGTTTVTITPSEQLGGASARQCTVAVVLPSYDENWGNLYKSFTVTQDAGLVPSINLDNYSLQWNNDGDPCVTSLLVVTANCDWHISELSVPEWVHFNTLIGSSGITNVTIGIDTGISEARFADIEFYSDIDSTLRAVLAIYQREGGCE